MSAKPDTQPDTSRGQPDVELPASGIHYEVAADAVGESASLWSDAWKDLRRNPTFLIAATLIAIFAVIAVVPGLFTNADPRSCSLSNSLLRPSAEHLFGTDLQGCDYLARVIYGTRVSFIVGVASMTGTVFIAVLLGAAAGYYGGIIDTLLARMTDIWFAIPTVLGAIVILNSAEATTIPVLSERNVWSVVIVLCIFGWPSMMRLMRSSVLSERETDYVQAARALGAGDYRIITKHILPNAIAPVVVYATIFIGIAIAAEATLSFLGVGLQLPAISWGLMISTAQAQIRRAPHLVLFPGIFLSVMVFSFILMGDALRDALDPKLR